MEIDKKQSWKKSYGHEEKTSEAYYKQICQYPILSVDEEQKTVKRSKNAKRNCDREKAKEKLVISNLRFAFQCAKKFYYKNRHNPYIKMSLMDYVGECNRGLIKASNSYQPSRGRFCTYAYHAINTAVFNAFAKAWLIRMPNDFFKNSPKMAKLICENGKNLSDDFIKKALNIGNDELRKIKENENLLAVSMDFDDESLQKHYIDLRSMPDRDVWHKEIEKYVWDKIKSLPPKNKYVIVKKFFSDEEVTLKEMGKDLNVTRERIRQIIFKSLRILRKKIVHDRMVDELKNRTEINYDYNR